MATVDTKTAVLGGLATLGVLAGAAGGYLTVTTPTEQQCQIDLADAKARLELQAPALDACKSALQMCVAPDPEVAP